jgi:hypothetical protein
LSTLIPKALKRGGNLLQQERESLEGTALDVVDLKVLDTVVGNLLFCAIPN